MSQDLDSILEQASLPETTVPLCLRGDLQAQFEDLERQLQAARETGSDSLAGNEEARAIAEQIEALREQMTGATYMFRLTGIDNPTWNALVVQHEPRDGVAADRAWGCNIDEFFPALIRACLGDTITDAQWDKLKPVLSSGQHDQLENAALAVSRRKVDVPKSWAASEALRSSGGTSSTPDS